MRLAIVRQHYRPDGDVERDIEPALEALLERNVAISLYTRRSPQTRLQLIEPVVCDPFHVGALSRDWGFARAACTLIRRDKPSLVESHERLLCCDVYRADDGVHAVWLEERARHASGASRFAGALSPHDRYLLRVERRMYASPWLRAVICKSKMVRDEIRSRFGLPKANLPVIYNPVDTELYHPGLRAERARTLERHGIDAAAIVFLCVARDLMRGGVDTAIDALARIPVPAHLIVIGDYREIDRRSRRARALGIATRVTFLGPRTEARPYFGAADAFVLPTLYDPSPDAALRALACGLPVVTSTKSGAAELVLDNDAGLVCPSGDAAALAAHLSTLQDATARERFAGNARRAVLPLSPTAVTLQLVLLYRDLLATAALGAKGPSTITRAGSTPSVSR